MTDEKAPYGYCTNCAEPFDRPYTHCPFCNAVNPHLEEDLQKKKTSVEERLAAQMAANRQWADQNRAEVQAEVDARIEQNLAEMKSLKRPTLNSKSTGSAASQATGASAAGTDPALGEDLGRAFGMKPAAASGKSGSSGSGTGLLIGILAIGGLILLGVGLWMLLH